VPPLIPHLRGIRAFAEPCVGEGDLMRHLQSFGLICVYAGDIKTGQDALASTDYGEPDAIITNPPHDEDRKVMHALIAHFQNIAPSWLLLPQDWTGTKQAKPFLPACSDILPIGRLKLIAGTKHSGFDNLVWCRFDARHGAGPVFHPYRSALPPRSRLCAQCGKPYRPQRADARTCSNACRQRAYRERLSVTQM
jgi:hypothetical protein